jgi:polysaccharide biosynthesis/export protein
MRALQEAQEKIRLLLSKILVQPIVTASLATARPVQITISGEVFKPGIYSLNSGLPRINDALLVAGGTTVMADLRQVQVRRRLLDGTVMTQNIDLYASLQNGGSVPNLRLQDGDALVLARREVGNDDSYDRTLVARSSLAVPVIKVRVLNYAAGGIAVQSLPNGSSFIDVLTGVSTANSNLQDIALIRFDPERGRAVTLRLNARKALSGDISQNVPLQDNDVIVVGRNLLGKITNLLSTVTRPFYDVRTFLNFFDTLGGTNSDSNR